MIISNKLIKGFIFACLLPVLIGYASETTLPQQASTGLIINGQVLDSTTLKPIKDAEIQIGLQLLTERAGYSHVQITNEEGRYSFERIPSYYVGKDCLVFFRLKKSEGYANFRDRFEITKEYTKRPVLTYDFRLMKPTDEVTVRVKALNVVDKTPLNKIVLKLLENSKEKPQFIDFKEGLTDEKGSYEVKLPIDYWRYLDSPSSKGFGFAVGGKDYLIAINDCGYKTERNVTDQKIETVIGSSEYSGNLYLADSKKTQTVNCVLTNNEGKPLADTPVTVKLSELMT